jgi:hypothetical protein
MITHCGMSNRWARWRCSWQHLCGVALLAALAGGCGQDEFDRRLQVTLNEVRHADKFRTLDQQYTQLKDDQGVSPISLRLPTAFTGRWDPTSANPENASLGRIPWEMMQPEFVALPSIKLFCEGSAKDERGVLVPFFLHLAAGRVGTVAYPNDGQAAAAANPNNPAPSPNAAPDSNATPAAAAPGATPNANTAAPTPAPGAAATPAAAAPAPTTPAPPSGPPRLSAGVVLWEALNQHLKNTFKDVPAWETKQLETPTLVNGNPTTIEWRRNEFSTHRDHRRVQITRDVASLLLRKRRLVRHCPAAHA